MAPDETALGGFFFGGAYPQNERNHVTRIHNVGTVRIFGAKKISESCVGGRLLRKAAKNGLFVNLVTYGCDNDFYESTQKSKKIYTTWCT
jgi:hypothetical protein